MFRNPPNKTPGRGFGDANLGAVAGAVVGSIGSFFAPSIPRVILHGQLGLLLDMPKIGIICFFVGGVAGWLLGGQIGPWLGLKLRKIEMELVGGGIAGLLCALLLLLWAWYYLAS